MFEHFKLHCEWPKMLTKDQISLDAPCLFDDVDSAVAACVVAQREYQKVSNAKRKQIVARLREVSMQMADEFALWAVSETGRGDYQDKVTKQRLAASKTPGPEDLVPSVISGDDGMTLTEYSPFGVIGAVTPVTNPTATIINNGIVMVSSGNGLIVNAHPAACHCTNRTISLFESIIVELGGPRNLICGIKCPTVESGQQLLSHKATAANLVTGGPAVVQLALRSGKKSFCAGPGNPPVVVDHTADIVECAKAVYEGAAFDNNMICSDEKEVFVVASVADLLIQSLRDLGAVMLMKDEVDQLEKQVLKPPASGAEHLMANPQHVGQPASKLAKLINKSVPESCRLLICEVSPVHSFVMAELLMPILPIVRCKSFDLAVENALAAEHGFRHTSSIYSKDVNHITKMGREMNTSIFCINGNHLAGLGSGGEGHTSFSVTGTTGEGMTRPRTFVRERRFVIVGSLNF